MKKFIKNICAAALSGVFVLGAVGCDGGSQSGSHLPADPDVTTWSTVSPDGSITAAMSLESTGGLFYTVTKDDTTVVEKSALGFTIREDDLNFLTVDDVQTERITGSYDNISGKSAHVEYDCNQTKVTFKGWDFYFDVTMRAYDDGYAFRYGIRAINGGSGTITVESEDTEFALPQDSVVWAQPHQSPAPNRGDFVTYEESYRRRVSNSLDDLVITMPMLYQVDGTEIYSMITESGLIGSGFYGSHLSESQENSGTGILQTVHAPGGRADPDNVIAYPFESPWRLGITGTLKTVQESELVEKVYDDAEYWKPDNYDELSPEEQEIYNYDWVESGVVAWNWLMYKNAGQNDWALQRQYVDLAYEMGWKYTILDGGWNANFNEGQFLDFMDYANERGIKVIVWCDALADFGNGNIKILTFKLDTWESYGIAGIKIDFFDGLLATNPSHQGEDKETIEWYETIYQETAKRKMIVNCHGCNKPTGERRVYPNVISREAIRGNENISVDSTITVNGLFVRAVVGPTDFTPVVTPLSNGLTMGHQMALAILYECGAPSMADFAETYTDMSGGSELAVTDFYEAIPSLRDETVFLCGQLDRYYVAAVRVGNEWFIAGANTILETDVTFDFSFLGDGTYSGYLYTDRERRNDEIVKTAVNDITKESRAEVTIPENGGFVYHLIKDR